MVTYTNPDEGGVTQTLTGDNRAHHVVTANEYGTRRDVATVQTVAAQWVGQEVVSALCRPW